MLGWSLGMELGLGFGIKDKLGAPLSWREGDVEMLGCQLGTVDMDGCSLGVRDKVASALGCVDNDGV